MDCKCRESFAPIDRYEEHVNFYLRLFLPSAKIHLHERVLERPREQRLAEAHSLDPGDRLVHRAGGFQRRERGGSLQRRMGSYRAGVLPGRATARSVLQDYPGFSSE